MPCARTAGGAFPRPGRSHGTKTSDTITGTKSQATAKSEGPTTTLRCLICFLPSYFHPDKKGGQSPAQPEGPKSGRPQKTRKLLGRPDPATLHRPNSFSTTPRIFYYGLAASIDKSHVPPTAAVRRRKPGRKIWMRPCTATSPFRASSARVLMTSSEVPSRSANSCRDSRAARRSASGGLT